MSLSSLSAIQSRIASIEARFATLHTGRPPAAFVGNGASTQATHAATSHAVRATKTAQRVDLSPKTAFVTTLEQVLGESATAAAVSTTKTAPVQQVATPTPGTVTTAPPHTLAAKASAYPMPKVNKAVALYANEFIAAGKKHGVSPALLAAVAQTESAGNIKARSHVGALGLMQFMPATARSLKVDPLNPHSAIDGAARLLKSHMKTFGSTDLALAAYNAGPGNVRKYGGIPPFSETQNYVKKINALMKGVNS